MNLNGGQGFALSNLTRGYSAAMNYAYTGTDALGQLGGGNDVAITLSTAVPELASLGLLAAAGEGLQRRQRRR